MDEELRKLRQDVAVDLSPSSPAVIPAIPENKSPINEQDRKSEEDRGNPNTPASRASNEFHEWEMLSRHSAPNSPRSSTKGHFEDDSKIEVAPLAPSEDKGPQGPDELSGESSGPEGSPVEELPCSKVAMRDEEDDVVLPQAQNAAADPADVAEPSDAIEQTGEHASPVKEADAEAEPEDHQDMPVEAKEEPSPPDSPHLRSGTSSFSHISSPASYHFGNSDDEGSDSDSSQWTSDGEEVASKGQGSRAARSEADSEEAIQDVVAVSQEGSLGSLSDSDAGFRRLSRATSARSAPSSGGASLVGGSGSFSFPEVAAMALDLASLGSVSTQSPRSASSLQGSVTSSDGTEVTAEAPDTASDEAKAAADAALRAAQDITAAVAAEFGEDRAEPVDDVADTDTAVRKEVPAFEEKYPKKPRRGDVMGALRAGMDKLAAATQSTLQSIGSTNATQRFWVCLQEWASALMACLPAAERARARLQVELARMRARARSIGWSQIALAASLGIMAVVAGCALVKNAALHRALRRKDNEMNQLILMVFNLQESLQGATRASRVPIVRHACAVSSFSPLAHIQPANIVSFEALSATKAIYC